MNAITLADGRTFGFRQVGTGDPLVLLHGWSMSSAVFQEVMDRLGDTFLVLAPDLAGHGSSEPPEAALRLDSMAADIEEWLGLLGIEAARLLGWSLGGQVALQMALHRRIAIEKLILVSATPLFVAAGDWPYGLPVTQVKAMDRQIRRDYFGSMGTFFRKMFDGEEVDALRYREIIRFAVRDGSLPQPDIARQGLEILGRTDLREQLPAIAVPTLIHYGVLDTITVPAACRYIAKSIPGAAEVAWNGVGHAPFLSRPEASCGLWSDFLR